MEFREWGKWEKNLKETKPPGILMRKKLNYLRLITKLEEKENTVYY